MFKGERYEKSGESLTRRGKIVDEPGGVGGAVKSRGNISWAGTVLFLSCPLLAGSSIVWPLA